MYKSTYRFIWGQYCRTYWKANHKTFFERLLFQSNWFFGYYSAKPITSIYTVSPDQYLSYIILK